MRGKSGQVDEVEGLKPCIATKDERNKVRGGGQGPESLGGGLEGLSGDENQGENKAVERLKPIPADASKCALEPACKEGL